MIKFNETAKLLEHSAFFYTIAIDMDGRYSYISKNYDKSFDFTKESLLGKNFSVTLHPDDVKICAEVAGKCFESPEALFPITLRKLNGKGGFVITQWEMQAIVDEKNLPKGIFCIGYNITEHIKTSAELQNAYTEIASKEDQLHEIGLIQSHGVRRPLANIIGLTGILKTMNLDKNLANVNDMLVESAEQLDQVIKEIIDLAGDGTLRK
ncbi:MAG TPA: PAS domain S-box protein [Pelobium sp.]|nr:PAS domain S-box protein [Pelobium sp.]